VLREGRISVVAAGKAAPAMAAAAARALGRRFAGGIVAAPSAMPRLPKALVSFRAGHPVPNRSSLAAGRAVWELAGRLRPDDLLFVLLSGGASSLLVLPAIGVSLADKIAVNRALLRAGASIAEVNAVRKHISRLKGGGLLRRADGARVIALLLSDVIGGSPSVIASGPTAADPTTYADACRILERHALWSLIPTAVRRRLERGRRGLVPETLKPGERTVRNLVIGDNRLALRAAAAEARLLGFEPRIVSGSLHGEARRASRRFAERLRRHRSTRDVCFLAGGETTVTVRGDGRGGRNQEFALALVEELRGLPGIDVLAAGTDGRDGPTDAAGAFVDENTADRARARHLDPREHLERNDSYGFFARLGALFRPGPTGTNVMDIVIAIVRGRGRR
jgi:glycerate-2-kinase